MKWYFVVLSTLPPNVMSSTARHPGFSFFVRFGNGIFCNSYTSLLLVQFNSAIFYQGFSLDFGFNSLLAFPIYGDQGISNSIPKIYQEV